MSGIDFKKEYKQLYSASAVKPAVVDVPEFNILAMDGEGRPDEAGFQQAASTLYPVVYTLKYGLKAADPTLDFTVMPMQVRWNLDRPAKHFTWTMLLVVPDFITSPRFETALKQVEQKFNPPALSQVRLERWREGRCVQFMHRGPYEGMNDTFAVMKQFAVSQGLTLHTDTHDIYLNSVLRTRPENLRAIMRAAILN